MKKIIIFLFLIFGMTITVSATLIDGQQAYFSFDDTNLSGSNPLDLTGNFVATNTGATTGVTGKINEAFTFGAGDTLSTNIGNVFSTGVTMSLWVNLDDTSLSVILDKWLGTGSNRDFILQSNNGKFLFIISTDGISNADAISTTNFTPGVWYNIVGTYDNNDIKIYVNGILEDTDGTLSGSVHAGSETIEMTGLGKNDEWSSWNRALNQSEVTQLYNSGVGFQYPYTAAVPSLSYTNITVNNITLINNSAFNTSSLSFNTSVLNISTNGNVNQSYSLNGGSLVQYTINNITGNFSLNLSEGFYNISFFAENDETNITSNTYNFTVDLTPPTIDIIGNITQDTFFVNFSNIFNVTDNLSGLASCTINITYLEANESDSNFFINCTDTQVFTRAGSYNGFLEAYDNAGNKAEFEVNGTINPLITIQFEDINNTKLFNYTTTIFHPDGRITNQDSDSNGSIFLSPVNDGELDLGNHTIEFNKLGFDLINVTTNINATSGGELRTFFIPGAQIFIDIVDVSDNSPLINGNTTIQIFGSSFAKTYVLENVSNITIQEPSMIKDTYTLIVFNEDYESVTRQFNFNNQELIVVDVYMTPLTFPEGDTADVIIEVQDEYHDTQANIQTFQYIWDNSKLEYVLMSQKETDFLGTTSYKVILNTRTYNFCAEFNNNLFCVTDRQVNINTEKIVIPINKTKPINFEPSGIYQTNITFSLTNQTIPFNSTLNITSITFTYENIFQDVDLYCLEVFKKVNNIQQLVARPCSTEHSKGLSVNIIQEANETFIANAVINVDGDIRILDSITLFARFDFQEELKKFGLDDVAILLFILLIIGIGLHPKVHNANLIHIGLSIGSIICYLFFPETINFNTALLISIINFWTFKIITRSTDNRRKITFNTINLIMSTYIVMIFTLTTICLDLDNKGMLDDYGSKMLYGYNDTDSSFRGLIGTDSEFTEFVKTNSDKLLELQDANSGGNWELLSLIFRKTMEFVDLFFSILSHIFTIPNTIYALIGFTNEVISAFLVVANAYLIFFIGKMYFDELFK